MKALTAFPPLGLFAFSFRPLGQAGGLGLERWKGALRNARVVEFPEAGHFVPEEATGQIARFLPTGLADIA